MLRLCSKCGEMKNHSEGTKAYCQECQSEYKKAHYRANKETYLLKNKNRKASMQRFVDAAKSYPCHDCETSWPSCAMEYDHTEDNKIASVSTMIKKGSWSKLTDEIMKCDLVCACCHAVRTCSRY
jgi:uncharacterized Zn ribbon protein